jgi:riboflavin synthase
MFTGIVEETGRLEALAPAAAAWRLEVAAGAAAEGVALGDSVAVDGCCLTVVGREGSRLTFDVLAETLRLTDLSRLAPGARVNLERSLPAHGRIGGHFVTGHVDALGEIEALERRGLDTYLRIRAPAGSGRYLAVKGSVAVNGVSLTLAEADGDALAVWLIPQTLAVTNLGDKRPGDAVNLEFDLLAKYVEKILSARPA